MDSEEMMNVMREAIDQMRHLVLRHEERLDDFGENLRRSREDFDFKMNALIDSQIRNESEIAALKESTQKLKESTQKLKEATQDLKEASRSQLKRIEVLERV